MHHGHTNFLGRPALVKVQVKKKTHIPPPPPLFGRRLNTCTELRTDGRGNVARRASAKTLHKKTVHKQEL
jgi:hypothetical protein